MLNICVIMFGMNGYSADNYIIDQDYFSEYTYRTMPASVNGCGCIAVFNILKYLGQSEDIGDIISEMDSMYRIKCPGPTTMSVMRCVLEDKIPECAEHTGYKEARSAMSHSLCGILRYNEHGMPHFISYIKSGSLYRFFNVDDGLEDFEDTIDNFFSGHICRYNYISVFTVNERIQT